MPTYVYLCVHDRVRGLSLAEREFKSWRTRVGEADDHRPARRARGFYFFFGGTRLHPTALYYTPRVLYLCWNYSLYRVLHSWCIRDFATRLRTRTHVLRTVDPRWHKSDRCYVRATNTLERASPTLREKIILRKSLTSLERERERKREK